MKRQRTFLAAALLIAACVFQIVASTRAEDAASSDKMIVTKSDVDKSGLFRHRIEAFPNEIYLGDTLYLGSFIEFISEEKISDDILNVTVNNSSLPYVKDDWEITVTSPEISGEYRFYKETFNIAEVDAHEANTSWLDSVAKISAGEETVLRKTYLELPPLEDWNHPFWKELRNKLSRNSEGIVCNVKVQENYRTWTNSQGLENSDYSTSSMEFQVLVKSRPQDETNLLNSWYDAAHETRFPIVYKDFKCPRESEIIPGDYELRSSGECDIEILDWKCDPWCFIRIGNRKPADPNIPTTLAGWRELESGLAPSTMRDEIRLTRLRLECFAAKDEKTERAALEELRDWFKSLPEIQRGVMARYCYPGLVRLADSPVWDKKFGDKSSKVSLLEIQLDPYRRD